MLEKLTGNEMDGFEDETGCHWDTKADYLFTGVLPSCGCGDPSDIGKYVRDMFLKHVKQTGGEDYSCWDNTKYEDLPVMFFLSWADRAGYIEHGSTVRCSWMTDKGNELLDDLNEVLKDKD